MTYIVQFKRRGYRTWQDYGEFRHSHNAMSMIACVSKNAYRVRVLEMPPAPNGIAEAFMWNPKVIFEGVFKEQYLEQK